MRDGCGEGKGATLSWPSPFSCQVGCGGRPRPGGEKGWDSAHLGGGVYELAGERGCSWEWKDGVGEEGNGSGWAESPSGWVNPLPCPAGTVFSFWTFWLVIEQRWGGARAEKLEEEVVARGGRMFLEGGGENSMVGNWKEGEEAG